MTNPSQRDVIPLMLADFLFPGDAPLAGQRGVVMGYSVARREGVLIVDTGIGFGHEWVDKTFRPRARHLPEVLEEAGLDIRDVVAVVNSHLHFDHSGQNSIFPRVPIYVQEAEWEIAHATNYTVLDWIDFPEARYQRVSGDHTLFPGVDLIFTPGHTAGHQSVLIESQDGIVVIAGQAVYTAGEWTQAANAWEGSASAWDPSEYTRSVERLRKLKPVRVYFGHDRKPWMRTAGRTS
jgi:N-acyl homoserine lactone hydrolase